MGYIIAASLLVALVTLILLPIRLKLNVTLRGAFARGRVRAGLCWGLIGVRLNFSVYKNAAGKPEARVWIGNGKERIINLTAIADKRRENKKRAKEKPEKAKRPKRKKKTGRLINAALKGLRLSGVSIKGRVGSGDAAATALTIGAISAAAYSLFTPLAKAPPAINISPNFDEAELRLELAGIVDVYIGKSTLVLIRKWT